MRPVIAVLHDCHSWHVGCALRHSLPAAKHISRNLKRMHVYIHIHTYMYINCNYKTTPNPTYVHTHTRTHSLTLTLTHTLTHTFPCPFRCMYKIRSSGSRRLLCLRYYRVTSSPPFPTFQSSALIASTTGRRTSDDSSMTHR